MSNWIALDIDGTITVEHHSVPEEVVRYFSELHNAGLHFLFVTGRSFQWGYSVLQHFPFNYLFGVQNGALLLEMPSRKIASRKYLNKNVLPSVDKIAAVHETDYAIYAGFEQQDRCYYRPRHFPPNLRSYALRRAHALNETWIEMEDFADLPFEEFPAIKAFAPVAEGALFVEDLERQLGLHVPLIKDPFDSKMVVMQATHPGIHKGSVITDLRKLYGASHVIAAGDDLNDLPMLEQADLKIAMETAPQSLLDMADHIAPSAEKCGIINVLKQIYG